MGKEQYFIITILLVEIVTVLPIDEEMFVDSSQLSAAGSSNFKSKLPSQFTCGIRKAPSLRIVGGIDSQLGAWPWMVALGYKQSTNTEKDSIQWLCGGTLISNTHVITACTCVSNIGSRLLTLARLGDLNLNSTIDDGATPLDIPIKRIIRHKEYNHIDSTNNIALLVLKNIISFTALIQPICLPQLPNIKNMDLGNSFSFVAGWGDTEFRGPSTTSLKEVQVPIINIKDCIKAYENKRPVIDDRTICAGEKDKDACAGDSGGPLMLFKEKQFYLMGIVSFGYKCGEPNYPGVYTRVSYYLDWILERINN